MALYMVSYDIPKEHSSYVAVVEHLRDLGAVNVLESQWLVAHGGNSEAIFKRLKGITQEGDRILVQRVVAKDSIWENVIPKDEEMELRLCPKIPY